MQFATQIPRHFSTTLNVFSMLVSSAVTMERLFARSTEGRGDYRVSVERTRFQRMPLFPVSYHPEQEEFRPIPNHIMYEDYGNGLDNKYQVVELAISDRPLVIPGNHFGPRGSSEIWESAAWFGKTCGYVHRPARPHEFHVFEDDLLEEERTCMIWYHYRTSRPGTEGDDIRTNTPREPWYSYHTSCHVYHTKPPVEMPGWLWRGYQFAYRDGNVTFLHHYTRVHLPPPLFQGFLDLVSSYIQYSPPGHDIF